MNPSRRRFLIAGSAVAVYGGPSGRGAVAASRVIPARTVVNSELRGLAPGVPGRDYRPVVTPNGATLPFKVVDGVKVFHLTAEPVTHIFVPGLEAECWGYNGRVHGPTIEAVEGDRVRVFVTNKLPQPTTVHWHGVHVPSGMDGVSGLSQRAIEPRETFKYEFTLKQHGTFMYHSHHDEMTQMALGLMGLFVVHPRRPATPPPDRDYAFLLSEWAIPVGARRPDPLEMTDFNVLTLNAAVFPATVPIVAKTGERVRLRFGNLSAMDHHPMHLHGLEMVVVETDGGVVPESARFPEATVLVPVGATRTVDLIAHTPGDWALHCHMTHHTMTQMGHGTPNLVGADVSAFDAAIARAIPAFGREARGDEPHAGDAPGAGDAPPNSFAMMGSPGPRGFITMGGMFTLLKVRDDLKGDGDPGWYESEPGTQAGPATEDEIRSLGG
jgi:manganese oxidase